MWLITERGIGDFLISLSLPGRGSVLTHHTACHHPRAPLPCSREAISDPTIISQTRVQAFHKIKSVSTLQTLSWRRKLPTGSQGENKRRWLRGHTWSTAHTTNPADVVFLLVLEGGDSRSVPCFMKALIIVMCDIVCCTHYYAPVTCMNHFLQC